MRPAPEALVGLGAARLVGKCIPHERSEPQARQSGAPLPGFIHFHHLEPTVGQVAMWATHVTNPTFLHSARVTELDRES